MSATLHRKSNITTFGQFYRYVFVGLTSNAIIYFMYLGLTWAGMGHKTSMTLLYAVGVLQTFLLNKNWSFRHQGSTPTALRRYVLAYVMGYVVNYLALWSFVDQMGFSHQWVQGVMIITISGMLFLLQKYWIFSASF